MLDFLGKYKRTVLYLIAIVFIAVIITVSVIYTRQSGSTTDFFGPNRPVGDTFAATRTDNGKIQVVLKGTDNTSFAVMFNPALGAMSSSTVFTSVADSVAYLRTPYQATPLNKSYDSQNVAPTSVYSAFVPISTNITGVTSPR
jgi:hypothetical protein